MINFKVDNLKSMKENLADFVEFLRLSGANDEDIFASKLISCELITNVIRHGGDEAEFTGTIAGDKIIITVAADSLKDINLNRPAPDVFAENGRGLYIVKSFCCELCRGESGEVRVVIRRHAK